MTVPEIIIAILHCLSNGWHVGLLCAFGLYQQATNAWDVRSCAISSDLWATWYHRVDESEIANWWTLTSIYNKHFNERHSVILEKHWNLFSVWVLPRTLLRSSRCFPRPLVSWGGEPSPSSFSLCCQQKPLICAVTNVIPPLLGHRRQEHEMWSHHPRLKLKLKLKTNLCSAIKSEGSISRADWSDKLEWYCGTVHFSQIDLVQ